MTLEERIEELENRRRALQNAYLNNEPIIVETTNERGERVLTSISPDSNDYLAKYQEENRMLDKQIRRSRLEDDYANRRPLIYHFVDDDGQETDVELGANDVDYDRAYRYQRDSIETGTQTADDLMRIIDQGVERENETNEIVDRILENNPAPEVPWTRLAPIVEQESAPEFEPATTPGPVLSPEMEAEADRMIAEIRADSQPNQEPAAEPVQQEEPAVEEPAAEPVQPEEAFEQPNYEKMEYDELQAYISHYKEQISNYTEMTDEEMQNLVEHIKQADDMTEDEAKASIQDDINYFKTELRKAEAEIEKRKTQKDEIDDDEEKTPEEMTDEELQEYIEVHRKWIQKNSSPEAKQKDIELWKRLHPEKTEDECKRKSEELYASMEIELAQAEAEIEKRGISIDKKIENSQNSAISAFITPEKPFVIVKSGDKVYVISNGIITRGKIRKTQSPLITNSEGNFTRRSIEEVQGLPFTVTVDKDGEMTVSGADEVEYYNQPSMTKDLDESDFGLVSSADSPKSDNYKFDDGLGELDEPDFDDPNFGVASSADSPKPDSSNLGVIDQNPIIPPTAKHIKSREENKTLREKFKKWLPVIIGAAVVIGAGIILYNYGPEILEGLKHLISGGQQADTSSIAKQVGSTIGDITGHIGDTVKNFSGSGHISGTISDAVSGIANVSGDIVQSANTAPEVAQHVVAIGDSWAPGAVSGFVRVTGDAALGGTVDLNNVDTVYATLNDAINGTNGMPISEYARPNIVGVYDQLTGAFNTAADAINNIAQGGRIV